jgi:hypothetical protein
LPKEFGLVFKLGTGVNVMIPIFVDVHQYSANKIGKNGFFLKANAMTNFFQKLSVFFIKYFGENIF